MATKFKEIKKKLKVNVKEKLEMVEDRDSFEAKLKKKTKKIAKKEDELLDLVWEGIEIKDKTMEVLKENNEKFEKQAEENCNKITRLGELEVINKNLEKKMDICRKKTKDLHIENDDLHNKNEDMLKQVSDLKRMLEFKQKELDLRNEEIYFLKSNGVFDKSEYEETLEKNIKQEDVKVEAVSDSSWSSGREERPAPERETARQEEEELDTAGREGGGRRVRRARKEPALAVIAASGLSVPEVLRRSARL
jgi:hypothetical protein